MLSASPLTLDDIASYHRDSEASFRLYFSDKNPKFEQRFLGYTYEDLNNELNNRILELDHTVSLSLLASMEALFRLDYLARSKNRKKDSLSKALRELYKKKKKKVPLEDDGILDVWIEYTENDTKKRLLKDLKKSYKYRHWLAHGRYWVAKTEKSKYDYNDIYRLIEEIVTSFPINID